MSNDRSKLAIGMANEGIPIGPIARVLGSTISQVTEILEIAHEQGMILDMPAIEWDGGPSCRSAVPSLNSMVEVQIQLTRRFRFSAKEAAICALLMHTGVLRKENVERLHRNENHDEDHAGGIDGKTVDVYICFLRKSLCTLGIHIETIRGQGWALAFPEKQKLFDLLFPDDAKAEVLEEDPMHA